MERAICEKCGERQPPDWAPADLCVACGAAVRREARCAWCAGWSPAGRFCRSCGCELVDEGLYGAARMLKSAGVDRFSIVQKLGSLDRDQVENLSRIYAAQLAVVLRRCEEARLCETCLLQKNFSRRLEEELVPLLPMEREPFQTLASGPAGPFDNRPELIPEIARESPVLSTRLLAGIAMLRQGIKQRAVIAAARDALAGEDRELAVEAALGLGHWRVRLERETLFYDHYSGGAGIDCRRLAGMASLVPPGSPLRPWAAAAFALGRFPDGVLPEDLGEAPPDEAPALESLRDALHDGITATNPDLRLTCALALGVEEFLAAELGADDEARRSVARRFLAKHKSPAVQRCLIEGPDDIRKEVLDCLWTPLPGALVDSVLRVVEKGDAQMRRTGLELLLPTLTAESVSVLVDVALREADLDMLKTLLRTDSLPESRMVLRRAIGAGYFRELYPALLEGAGNVDFSDEAVARLAGDTDPEVPSMLATIADKQLWEQVSRGGSLAGEDARILGTGRFLAKTAFGPGPEELRCRAYGSLSGCRLWDWMGPQVLADFFDTPGEFLEAVTRLLKDPEAQQMCLRVLPDLQRSWEVAGPCFAEYRGALRGLLACIVDLIRGHFLGQKGDLAELIVTMVPLYPAETLEAIVALLGDREVLTGPSQVLRRLREGYPVFGRYLGNDPEVLAQAVRALIELYEADDWASSEIRPVALELLAAAAADHPECREQISARFGFHLVENDFEPGQTRELKRRIAEILGFEIPSEEGVAPGGECLPGKFPSGYQGGEQPAIDLLDNEVIFPGEPFPTLSEYCGFLKAMGSAVDPVGLMANRGLSADEYVRCVTAWAELISRRDDFAIRYSQLVAG